MGTDKIKISLITTMVGLGVVTVALLVGKPAHQPVALAPIPYQQQPYEAPIEPAPQTFSFDEALASINVDEIKANLEFLTSDECNGRMSGEKGNEIACEYIKKQYESYGLPTKLQEFGISHGSRKTNNVIAWIDGNDPTLKDEIVVIGAHYDHIGTGNGLSNGGRGGICRGADDNGSGTVGLLAIAKAFSMVKDQVQRTIVFISFSGEELGLVGSRYYCKNPLFPESNPSIKKHILMFNMDMIGYLEKGETNVRLEKPNSKEIFDSLCGKYPFAKGITDFRGGGGSDYAPFRDSGVPIVSLFTGMTRVYHTPADTIDKCNLPGIQKVACYCFEFAWLAQKASAPSFNWTKFVPAKTFIDHEFSRN